MVAAGCGSSTSDGTPPPKPTPPAPAPTPDPSPKPTPPPSTGLPGFADVTAIDLHQQQGGPSQIRCNGTVYEMHIDLGANTWTSGLCPYEKSTGPTANTPLEAKHGTLTAAQRDAIAAAYARLAIRTTATCGNDGGDLTLTVYRSNGVPAVYVDENWGCNKPPPIIADNLKDLATALGPIALYGP
jgi:hypothetical protein